MDLSQKIIAAILAGFFLVALIRVFSSPFRLALKLLFWACRDLCCYCWSSGSCSIT